MKKESEGFIVYQFLNKDNQVLYVGKSIKFSTRIRQHINTQPWWNEVSKIKIANCVNKTDMDVYEIYYINKLYPLYNINESNNMPSSFTLNDLDFIEYELSNTTTNEISIKNYQKNLKQDKNTFTLNGKHLFLISIIYTYKSINQVELFGKLTYEGKMCICENTLRSHLKDLVEQKYIFKEVGIRSKGESNIFKINSAKCHSIKHFYPNNTLLQGVIKRVILPEDYNLYCMMRFRYKHKLSLTYESVSKEIKGTTKWNMLERIQRLIDGGYLEKEIINETSGYLKFTRNFYIFKY